MKSVTIKTRLIVGFSILVLLNIAMCVLQIQALNQIMKASNPLKYAEGAQIFVVALGAVSTIFGLAIEFSVVRIIRVSMEKITDASKKIALGEVDIKIEKERDDEFGVLTDAIQQMIAGARSQAEIAEQIAKGNLAVSITPRSDKDLLGKALRDLIEDNNRMLGGIRESAIQVTTGADQVASASQSLAQGSTEQASALQQVNASINEIAEKTKANAAQANETNALVQDIKKDAGRGNAQMKDMIHAMNEINQASENISKIIKVINDISFQTNILSLNAAVEAARAGEAGKGFAVVAEEVRSLAAKSSSAASEIEEMIEDSINKVKNGSKLAEETEKALDEIVDAIGSVSLISNIAQSSNEQATAVAQIDQAISQVSQVVQTNSATSEECAAASEELSTQAIRLKETVGSYTLDSRYTISSDGGSSYYGGSTGYSSYSPESDENEKIISLGSGFGKY